jgi:T-complex protein 1 subunit epsilon
MNKTIENPKIAILTCPFEPPKPKTKHGLEIKSAEDYKALYEMEQRYFTDQIERLQKAGANTVLCQWGFDDEANHLLYQNGIQAVRWVGGVDIEHIAIATGGRIIPRFEELSEEKLGNSGFIRELSFGTTNDKVIQIEDCPNSKAVTILVRGGSKTICDEANRCLHDALCVVRNMIKNNNVVPGGGASEMAAAIAVNKEADQIRGVEQYAVRAFADALEEIPMTLAENSGFDPITYVASMKERQMNESDPFIGVDGLRDGVTNMMEAGIYESVMSKRQQMQLATQVVKMILKIDDVIAPSAYE